MAYLDINGLAKHYTGYALGPVNLQLDCGCAAALIGANGAGKSTLFRCLVGSVRRDGGTVSVAGQQTDEQHVLWRQQLGYIGDFTPFFNDWTGHKNLRIRSQFYPAWQSHKAESIAERLQLDLNKKVKTYSTGQRTKLSIVCALAHSPALLLFDEPSNGLDPVARQTLLELLFEEIEAGETALLYATHHVSEVEGLADRLIFLNNGTVTLDAIKDDLTEKWRHLSFRSEQAIGSIPYATPQKSELPYQQVISEDYEASAAFLQQQGIHDIEISRLSAEQIAVEILRNNANGANHVS